MAQANAESTTSRRSFLAASAALPAVVGITAAAQASAAPDHPDAGLLVLEVQINRMFEENERVYRERVEPHTEAFNNALSKWARAQSDENYAAMLRCDEETGRAAAIDECDRLCAIGNELIDKMWAIPAITNVGRSAKVRVFYNHIASNDMLTPDNDLDWDASMMRRLVFEMSGFSAADWAPIQAQWRA